MTTATEKIEAVRTKAKDYLARYDGPVVDRVVVIESPVLRKILRRDWPLFARNALYVCHFARTLFPADIIDPLEEALTKKLNEMEKRFANKLAQVNVLIANNDLGSEDSSHGNIQDPVQITIATPLSHHFLNTMYAADRLIAGIDTLWLNGRLTGSEKQTQQFAIKKEIRGSLSFLRQTWGGLRKRVEQGKQEELDKIEPDSAQAGEQSSPTPEAGLAEKPATKPRAARAKPTTGSQPAASA